MNRVSGDRRFAINPNSDGSWTMYDGANTMWNQGITQKAGNVGIGTTNPKSKLAVSGLPKTPPDTSGMAGMLCVTNDGNIWVDDDSIYDCT